MERSEILDMMSTLQLAGMRAAYDEIVSVGIKRQHSVEKVIGALLKAEIMAKQARSINYQLRIAKLPLAKELADIAFEGTPINGGLIEQLSTGAFLDDKRNVVLIGGTGTGKSHIAIGITRSVIRTGRKARFFPSALRACARGGCRSGQQARSRSQAGARRTHRRWRHTR